MGINIGLVGLGSFGTAFAKLFASHPLVDKVALCDCEGEKIKKILSDPFMSQRVSERDCYLSLDEICKVDDLDALAIITQPWLHAPQCLQALASGKSVYSAVPVISLPDDDEVLDWCGQLIEAVERTGRHYMLGETTVYRPQTMYCLRQAKAGAFGDFTYAEGEYVHDVDASCNLRSVVKHRTVGVIGSQYAAIKASYRKRGCLDHPMSYPTHSVSGPIVVMDTRAVKVSALGTRNTNNDSFFDGHSFSNITALFKLANGAALRVCEFREVGASSFDRQESEIFRVFGKSGSFSRNCWEENGRTVEGTAKPLQRQELTAVEMRDPLPAEVAAAFKHALTPNASAEDDFQPSGHGGSHPYLVHEFISSVAENREPSIPARLAGHFMAMGVAAHRSALRDGEQVQVPNIG